MVDAALAGLAVLVTAAMVTLALVRFFAALHPDPGAAVRPWWSLWQRPNFSGEGSRPFGG
jgi:hypothetical protein